MTGKPTCDGGPQGICALRGRQHPRCSGHRKGDGQPCGRHPRTGTWVCRQCGGSAPQVKAAGKARATEARAARELTVLGQPVPVDASQALLDLIAWKHAEVLALRSRVAMLTDADLVWGRTSETEKTSGEFPGTDTTRSAEANVWWRLLRQAEDQLAAYAAAAHRAGIDERRQRLAEDQGRFAIAVLKRAIDGLLAALIAAGLERALQEAWPRLVADVVPSAIKEIADQQEGPHQ